jgi:hypothetical protein
MDVNDNYVTSAPSAQAAIDLFPESWSSLLPLDGVMAGTTPLFADDRLKWLIDFRGRFDDQHVLELGPLEGGHSYMLEKAGAESVLAIEANTVAYLKCLVVKELLDLKNVQFKLGNFDRFLEHNDRRFDLVLASGVLYHLIDPLSTLQRIMAVTDEIFIWSQFYDDVAMPVGDPRRAGFTGETVQRTLGDDTLTYHLRTYGSTTHPSHFCGGVMSDCVWTEKTEIVALLEKHGYAVTPAFEHDAHPNGPAACLYASRRYRTAG